MDVVVTTAGNESKAVRGALLLLAWVLTVAFFVWTQAYFEPIHVGVDQNGYLVGGKQFSRTLLPRQTPTAIGHPDQFDPHAFVANMWVAGANDPHSFDPKYPIGLPLIYAITIWITGGGTTAAFYVSPVAMALTLPAVFLLVRRFAGSYGGLLAMLAFATSPLIGSLVNNPNSHAVSVFCATWGMVCVLHWWHEGGKRWAILGGLLVGYTATVRYTEGMLVLPLLWAAVVKPKRRSAEGTTQALHADTPAEQSLVADMASSSVLIHGLEHQPMPPRKRSRLIGSALLLIAWAVPVACLAAYNLFLLGTLTGYDATNESTGFGWTYFFENWETLLRNMGTIGLFLLLPLAVIGVIRMAYLETRQAIFLLLWAGPCLTLYAFYYWGPDGVGYLRFITTTLPPLLAGTFWLMRSRAGFGQAAATERRRIVWPVLRWTLAGLAAVAVGAVVYFTVLYDRETHQLISLATYLARPATTYQRLGGIASFAGGMVVAVTLAAAMVGATRRSAGALAAGVVTLLNVAGSAEATRLSLETVAYDTRIWQADCSAIRNYVPDGAMLVCRDESILHYLQFVTDDRLYTGLTFDRGWVDGRPRAASDDPVLIDPVRNQQLFDSLKGFNQAALNEQARNTVKTALSERRRVFVVEAAPLDPLRQAIREKKDGPVPEFVRRFINANRPKDKNHPAEAPLVGKRVGWWTVPQVVKDEVKNVPRGRKPGRPNFRTVCYQVWEVTMG